MYIGIPIVEQRFRDVQPGPQYHTPHFPYKYNSTCINAIDDFEVDAVGHSEL